MPKVKHRLCKSPEYVAWTCMKTRCLNPRSTRYSDYGGRGVTICARWNEFLNFLSDMGRKPSRLHTLDRKDSHKNYTPSNCRWATILQQNRNRRNIRLSMTSARKIRDLHARGMSVAKIASQLNISKDLTYKVLQNRLWKEHTHA